MSQFSTQSTRTYKVQATGDRESLPQDLYMGRASVVATKRKRANRASFVMVSLCLVLAVTLAVVVPMMLDGSFETTPTAKGLASTSVDEITPCTTIEEAQGALGFAVQIPAFFALNCELKQVNIVNGTVFEAFYIQESAEYTFRMAQGNQDPSGIDDDYTFTSTQNYNNMTCRFMGKSEDKIQAVVWLLDDNIYSLQTTAIFSHEQMTAVIYSMPALNGSSSLEADTGQESEGEAQE